MINTFLWIFSSSHSLFSRFTSNKALWKCPAPTSTPASSQLFKSFKWSACCCRRPPPRPDICMRRRSSQVREMEISIKKDEGLEELNRLLRLRQLYLFKNWFMSTNGGLALAGWSLECSFSSSPAIYPESMELPPVNPIDNIFYKIYPIKMILVSNHSMIYWNKYEGIVFLEWHPYYNRII